MARHLFFDGFEKLQTVERLCKMNETFELGISYTQESWPTSLAVVQFITREDDLRWRRLKESTHFDRSQTSFSFKEHTILEMFNSYSHEHQSQTCAIKTPRVLIYSALDLYLPHHYTNELRIISSLISFAYCSLKAALFSRFYHQLSLTKNTDLFVGDVSTSNTPHRTRNSH